MPSPLCLPQKVRRDWAGLLSRCSPPGARPARQLGPRQLADPGGTPQSPGIPPLALPNQRCWCPQPEAGSGHAARSGSAPSKRCHPRRAARHWTGGCCYAQVWRCRCHPARQQMQGCKEPCSAALHSMLNCMGAKAAHGQGIATAALQVEPSWLEHSILENWPAACGKHSGLEACTHLSRLVQPDMPRPCTHFVGSSSQSIMI